MHSNLFFFKLQNRLNSSHAPAQKWICLWESVSSISFKKEATKSLSMQNNSQFQTTSLPRMTSCDARKRLQMTSLSFCFCVDKKGLRWFLQNLSHGKICWRLFWRHPLMMSAQHFSSQMLKRLKERGFCRKVELTQRPFLQYLSTKVLHVNVP